MNSDAIESGDFESDGRRPGANIGGGIMAFAGNNVGFRGDLRFFNGFRNDAVDTDENVTLGDEFLSGLSLWRATAGLAFRW